jgi:hypothetical protein
MRVESPTVRKRAEAIESPTGRERVYRGDKLRHHKA